MTTPAERTEAVKPDWHDRPTEPGMWPQDCMQRAFVEGAKWWQWTQGKATASPSEVDLMEAEAVRRYGPLQPDTKEEK